MKITYLQLIGQTVVQCVDNVCFRYHKSLVGRDFKLWAQIGIFIVWPFLTHEEQRLWLSFANVSLYC